MDKEPYDNKLNNMATTEAEIVSMSMRLAAQGKQVGMTEANIMALAGTMSSLGIEAEAGGSAMTMILTKMQKAVGKGGQDLKSFAKAANMSAKEFAESFKKDPIKALELLAQGLGKSAEAGGNMTAILEDLGIKGIREADVMKRLAGNSELLGEAVDIANVAWKENTALTKEAEERYKTFESKLAIFKNVLKDLGITIGDVLLPVLITMMEKVSKVVEWVGKLNPKIIEAGVIFTAVSAAIMLIVGPLLMLIGFIPQILSGFKALSTVFKFTSKYLGKFGGFLKRVLKPATLLRGGLRLLGRTIGVLAGPIGWVILILVELALIFHKLFKTNEEFRKKVTTAWNVISTKVRGAVAEIVRVVGPAFSQVKDAVLRIVTVIREGVTKGFASMSKVGTKIWEKFGDSVNKTLDTLLAVWNRVWPTMEKVLKFAWDNFKSIVEIGTKLVVGLLDSVALFLSGDFSGAWELAVSTVKTAVTEIGKLVFELGYTIGRYLAGKLEEAKKAIANKLAEWIAVVARKMADIKNTFITKTTEWTSAVITWFTSIPAKISKRLALWGVAIATWMTEQKNAISEKLNGWGEAIFKWFTEMPSKIATKLKGWGTAIKLWTKEQNDENIRQFTEWGKSIMIWFNSIPDKITEGLVEWGVAFGTWFIDTKTLISDKLTEWKDVLIEWLVSVPITIKEKLVEWTVSIGTWFIETKTSITEWLSEWVVAIGTWFTSMPGNIVNWLATWWVNISTWFSEIPMRITMKLAEWWIAIKTWFSEIPYKTEVKDAGKKLIDKLAQGTKEQEPDFMEKLGKLILTVLGGALAFVLVAVVATGRELIKLIIKGFNEMKSDLGDKAKELIIAAAKKMASVDLAQVGKDLIRGLIRGIGSMVREAEKAARAVASAVKTAVTSFFAVKSPSRVMMGIGVNIVEGLNNGMLDMRGAIKRTAAELSEAATIKPDLSYATPNANYGSLSAALSGEVNVNQRDSRLIGAIESLERKMTNLVVEMDGQTVGVIVAPTVSESINAQADGTSRGRGRRRI